MFLWKKKNVVYYININYYKSLGKIENQNMIVAMFDRLTDEFYIFIFVGKWQVLIKLFVILYIVFCNSRK